MFSSNHDELEEAMNQLEAARQKELEEKNKGKIINGDSYEFVGFRASEEVMAKLFGNSASPSRAMHQNQKETTSNNTISTFKNS
jgi:hypothetical protein